MTSASIRVIPATWECAGTAAASRLAPEATELLTPSPEPAGLALMQSCKSCAQNVVEVKAAITAMTPSLLHFKTVVLADLYVNCTKWFPVSNCEFVAEAALSADEGGAMAFFDAPENLICSKVAGEECGAPTELLSDDFANEKGWAKQKRDKASTQFLAAAKVAPSPAP